MRERAERAALMRRNAKQIGPWGAGRGGQGVARNGAALAKGAPCAASDALRLLRVAGRALARQPAR